MVRARAIAVMKTKLHLGKKTLASISLQVTTILESLLGGSTEIKQMKPHRLNAGNFVLVRFISSAQPEMERSRLFAVQRIGDCCDVWLEGPADLDETNQLNNDAA